MNAPIIVFAYNRPHHLKRGLESLLANEGAAESKLCIHLDAPSKNEDEKSCREVSELVEAFEWPGKKLVIRQEENKGLADSIVEGVSKLVNEYGSVIVLEDDLVVATGFLNYMNNALKLWKEEDSVMHISAYMFPIKNDDLPDTFFYNSASSWGWATWDRAWKKLDTNLEQNYKLLQDNGMHDRFTFGGNYDGFVHQVEHNLSGFMKTWAIKWHISMMLADGLSLHPAHSLVQNIGLDGSGTHKQEDPILMNSLSSSENPNIEKIDLVENAVVLKRMTQFYIDASKPKSRWRRLLGL